jgi:hypothetical protein
MSINDRTRKLVHRFLPQRSESFFRFDGFRIGITIDTAFAETFNGQVMIFTCLNLLSRFTNRLLLGEIPQVPTMVGPRKQGMNFETELLRSIAQINPNVKIDSLSRENPADALITIGNTKYPSSFKIAINSDGWISKLKEGVAASLDYVSRNANPIGAQVASCFASAEVFKHLLRRMGSTSYAVQQPVKSISFSALDYSIDSDAPQNPELPPELDLKEIVLVGAGAVGNSFVNTLGYLNDVTGRLVILDFDVVDVTNLNRYLVAGVRDVGKNKVNVASDFLKGSSIEAIPVQKSYESYVKEDKPDKMFDTVISTVDDNAARQHIQSDLPRQVLHGATHEQSCVVSRHDFLHDACLGCLFYMKSMTYAERISSETGIPLDEVEKTLSLSGFFNDKHLAIMRKERGISPERFSKFVGQPFKDVYAKEICGVFGFTTGAKSEAATVSFVSALPGILLAGEVIKDRIPELHEYRLNNYLRMSLFSLKANRPIVRKKDSRCSCLCYEQIMIDRYNQKWLLNNQARPSAKVD